MLPLLLAAYATPAGGALAALATSSHHVHLFRLERASGSLLMTLQRASALPTALAFVPPAGAGAGGTGADGAGGGAPALCVALRDGALCAFSSATGRALPWSPEGFSLPAAAADATRCLVPLGPLRMLAFGADHAAAIAFAPGPAAAAAQRSAGKQPLPPQSPTARSAWTATSSANDRFRNVRLAGAVRGADGSAQALVVVEAPQRAAVAAALAATSGSAEGAGGRRKRYGKS